MPLGTPLGLEYPFSVRHTVNPQFLSCQWISLAVRGERAVCLQPLEDVRSINCRLFREYGSVYVWGFVFFVKKRGGKEV